MSGSNAERKAGKQPDVPRQDYGWLEKLRPPEIPPLFQAIVENNTAKVKELIDAIPDDDRKEYVNEKALTISSSWYDTPLAIANRVGNKDIIQILIEAGAEQPKDLIAAELAESQKKADDEAELEAWLNQAGYGAGKGGGRRRGRSRRGRGRGRGRRRTRR